MVVAGKIIADEKGIDDNEEDNDDDDDDDDDDDLTASPFQENNSKEKALDSLT